MLKDYCRRNVSIGAVFGSEECCVRCNVFSVFVRISVISIIIVRSFASAIVTLSEKPLCFNFLLRPLSPNCSLIVELYLMAPALERFIVRCYTIIVYHAFESPAFRPTGSTTQDITTLDYYYYKMLQLYFKLMTIW